MKKTSPVIEIQPSLTENLRESPEEELRCISSNLSFEGTPQKVMALTAKRQPFTLNGWENTRQRSSKTLLKNTRSKQFSLACSTPSSTISHLLRPDPKCDNFRTLQPKQRKHMADLNFKCGERHGSMRGSTGYGSRPQQDSARFRQQLSKQKVGLLQFYQNQRVKRRLMMIEMAEPQSSITIIQYPLEISSPRPAKTARKISAYRRYFN